MSTNKAVNFGKCSIICMMLIIINVALFKLIWNSPYSGTRAVLGGTIYETIYDRLEQYDSRDVQPEEDYVERFLRPSSQKPLEKKYPFSKNMGNLPDRFSLPSELVRAYFDIISDASNMGGKKGGCGSIGYGNTPYTYAYDLFSQSLKEKMPYEKFLKSFEGVGHINLLKLVEAPAVKDGDTIQPRIFVEIEAIEGTDTEGKTCFAYYYGYITLGQEGERGWRISKIELHPEDFLCHAYHGWWHDASSIVSILYGQKCGIIDKVLNIEEDGYFRSVMAKGKDGKQYRFMFIRITNGADIELRQFVMSDGKWKDIYIDADKYIAQ